MTRIKYDGLPTEDQMNLVWNMLDKEHDKNQTKMEVDFDNWMNIFVNNKNNIKVDLNELEVETQDGEVLDFQEYITLVFP